MTQTPGDGTQLEPGQSVTWQAQYRHWLAFFAPPPVEDTGFSSRPSFAFFIDKRPGTTSEDVRRTVTSLQAQTYASWRAWLLSEGDPVEVDDSQVLSIACDAPEQVGQAIGEQLTASTCDFAAYVPAGDELRPDALLAVVAVLNEMPDADVVYTDRDQRASDGSLTMPFFKPDWSPALLMSMDYVSGLAVYKRDLVLQALADGPPERNALAYELALLCTERASSIQHIEWPLYTVACAEKTDAVLRAERRALEAALDRRRLGGRALQTAVRGVHEARPALLEHPRVTIVIPTRDRLELVKRSVESVRAMTDYDNYEIMLIDNESVEPETLEYMASFDGPVYRYPHPFNYARMMNLAAWATDATYIVFLNNDTEIISRDWLEGMLAWCQQPDVGIVGTRILHMDGSVHHEGITLWRHNVTVAHIWFPGYHGLSYAVREVAAVTGACLMARSSAYREIGGMDERMAVGYNDVDVCLRMWAAGYRVIYQGNVQLYHVAGASRGRTTPMADEWFFLERWPPEKTKDPYFGDNLLATWPVAILPP